jgi:hypothetical protein
MGSSSHLRRRLEPQRTGPPETLASASANFGEDLFWVGVLTGSLPRVDKITIHHYLEDPSARGHYHELRYLEFELF